MANDYFQFKRFTIHQGLCAMKVGTDGTLLGAWAHGGHRILDIGTGTGLIALMMAQRFTEAHITAIDIDDKAVEQAQQNVDASPFASRISVEKRDVTTMSAEITFDSIVCNPPYFVNSLHCPDERRTMARHADTLTYRDLMESATRLLADDGELSVVIPFDCRQRLESEAMLAGLFKVRICGVKTTLAKPPRRFLLAFKKHPAPLEQSELVLGSEAYHGMTKGFFLK